MKSQAAAVQVATQAAVRAAAEDPRAPNCRGFQVDSKNQVVGIELVVVRIPSAPYELYRAEMLDPYASGGNCTVKGLALDANNVAVGERIVIAWPFPGLDASESPQGPGNPENNFNISSRFDAAHGVIGPLAFHLVDADGNVISDIVGGYGQPMGYGHIGGRVTFRRRSSDVVPPPGPEPDGSVLERIAVTVERLAAHLGA